MWLGDLCQLSDWQEGTVTEKSYLTTTEVAAACGVPVWTARRAIDALGLPIPRAGLYRLLPREWLPLVRRQLDSGEEAVHA
jgi:hypothetical protein